MDSIITKILAGMLSLFTIVYFGYQIYHMTYSPYSTETALAVEYTDQVDLTGIAIRTEELVYDYTGGVVKYVDTGSKKVVADTVVATVYSSQEDMLIGVEVDELEEKLELLTTLESKQQTTTNVQTIVDSMRDAQLSFVNGVETNDYDSMYSITQEELSQMLRLEMILDSELSFTDVISDLTDQINTLTKSMSSTETDITVSSSGYFTDVVDGYESGLTVDYVKLFDSLTVDDVEALFTKETSVSSKTIGKLITTTEWYFLATFDAADYDSMVLDTEITLDFPNSTGYSVKATIENVSLDEDAEQGLVLLKSNNMNDVVVDLRVEQPAMVFSTDKGITVSKEAIRIVETEEVAEDGSITLVSTPGVYITTGQQVKFREIDVIYEGSDYVICELHEDESGYLHIYDEVILEGDDLYDGKAIR